MIKQFFKIINTARFKGVTAVFLAIALSIVMLTGCGTKPTAQAPDAAQQTAGEDLNLITPEATQAPEIQEAEVTPAPESAEAEVTEVPEVSGTGTFTPAEEEPEEKPEETVSTPAPEPEPAEPEPTSEPVPEPEAEITVEKNGTYTSKEEVALYIHTYGRLPSNYISKTKATERGWDASEGNLDEVLPGKSIGGGRYNNYEGKLPKGKYRECDINYTGGFRGPERLVYSEDGRIYYTGDHYKTFEQLY